MDNPNILGNFLLFVGQDQLGQNYLTYSHIRGSQNTLGKKYALHIRDVQALRINHVCDNFRPHGIYLFPELQWRRLGLGNSDKVDLAFPIWRATEVLCRTDDVFDIGDLGRCFDLARAGVHLREAPGQESFEAI